MWKYPYCFDVIIVGGGHAGCEAAHAAARMGKKTLLLTMNLDTLAKASCNPSIGGTAKGHIVREIDALGGIMGKVTDKTAIHLRILNRSKGPAVRSPRAQIDKMQYHIEMKKTLENTENLELKQATVIDIDIDKNKVQGVFTKEGIYFSCHSLVLCNGTFLKGLIHIGEQNFSSGRYGDFSSEELSSSLSKAHLQLDRLKTGTPPRIHAKSMQYDLIEKQDSEENVYFSFDKQQHFLQKTCCYITYTTERTKKIIQRDLHKSPLFSGVIQGVGPRYCPSIEDKIMRFKDKERHQVFLEPEGLHTQEVYVNGISSSMPFSTQLEIIHSIIGLEKAEILRPAYAIEYDYVVAGQIQASLETKTLEGLFLAGQINGTTGYEEAAAQGLIAGINAALKVDKKQPLLLTRSSSYIGVMIDDLITKHITEPYRMFTSRAEHRLILRHDNADQRLRRLGYEVGLITDNQMQQLEEKQHILQKEIQRLSQTKVSFNNEKITAAKLLSRPEITYKQLIDLFPSQITDFGTILNEQIEIQIKYHGYLEKQKKEIQKLQHLEKIMIPKNFSFTKVIGLRNEAREKLLHFSPNNLATAARIDGVALADISILMIALQRKENFL